MKIQILWSPITDFIKSKKTVQKVALFKAKKKIWSRYIKNIFTILEKKKLINSQDQRELSFYFCNNSQIEKINLLYRNEAYPTDVLAFPFNNSNEIFGEIIISIEKAYIQAKKMNVSLNYEILKLLIHGILHLLGYDHEKSTKEAKLMFDLQKKILTEVSKL